MADDPLDFTEKYNTPLAPEQEREFQDWTKAQSAKSGKDISRDLYDYDMRGDWLAGAGRDERGHGTDKFKKPNHPTFSTGSIYHGVDGHEGGQWDKKADGSWSFAPGVTNLRNYSSAEMKGYFQKVEPGNEIKLPGAAPTGDLNVVQRSFLKGLDLLEKTGVTPMHQTAIKLYNDVIQRGRTAPITEGDLSKDEREQLKQLVLAHSAKAGKSSGKIDYKDYFEHKSTLDQNILGGFQYSIGKNGEIAVHDTYDFNKNREGPPIERNPVIQAVGALANPRGLAAQIGRDVLPDTSGRGIPVRIKLR